jgi:hypothetical protein
MTGSAAAKPAQRNARQRRERKKERAVI